jgi:hypothetical protein
MGTSKKYKPLDAYRASGTSPPSAGDAYRDARTALRSVADWYLCANFGGEPEDDYGAGALVNDVLQDFVGGTVELAAKGDQRALRFVQHLRVDEGCWTFDIDGRGETYISDDEERGSFWGDLGERADAIIAKAVQP